MQGNQTRNAGQNQQQAQAGSQQQTAYQAPPAAAPQQSPVGGLRAGLKRNMSPVTANSADKIMVDLMKLLKDEYTNNPLPELKACHFEIIPIPRNSGSSNVISVIVVVLGTGDRFAYHSLLLAGDANKFREQTERFDSMPQPLVRAPSDFADDALMAIVKNKVLSLYPANVTTSADWSLVPEDFNMTDERLVKMLFANTVRACWSEIIPKLPNFQYSDLSGMAADSSGVVRTSFNQDQSSPRQEFIDNVGSPVRTEIVVDFRTEQKGNVSKDYQSEHSTQNDDLGRVQGFLNLNIDPVAARQNPWGVQPAMRNPNDTQEYSAEFVITGIDMNIDVDLGSTLLMLSTCFPLMDHNTQPWKRNLLPKHLQHQGYGPALPGRFNPRDIGALNFDYGLKDPKDGMVKAITTTDINEFGADEFYRTMATMVRDGLALSIDVPECGDSTWVLRPFSEANTVPQAYEAIIKAADGLTGGRFSQFFYNPQSSRKIVIDREERIINGYYIAEDGTKRDIREVDMLYLLNKEGHQDGTIARRWAQTFGGGNTNLQLIQRAKLLETVGHVVITGFSRRKTFHNDFLMALDQAIAATGLKIRNEIGMGDARTMIRPSAGLAQAGALNSNFSSGTYSYGSQGPTGGFRPMSHTRTYF